MKKKLLFATLLGCGILSTGISNANTPDELIGKKSLQLKSDRMTPEVLWSFGRLGDVQVSPDGKTLLYGVSYYSKEKNKSNRELFTLDINGQNKKQLTASAEGEYGAIWHPKGDKIAYLSAKSGSMQVWEMNPDGSNPKQISFEKGDITNVIFSPTGEKVFFTKDVKITKNVQDIYPDLPHANALLIDDLLYRHWDTWEDTYFSHIFVADYKNGKISKAKDIMPGEPYDTPLMPFGGIEEITWSPDGKKIAYTCKKQFGKEYALGTDSDIYIYNLESGKTINLTKGMKGYDRAPLYSPDGTKLAWLSMERAGFEADKDRLFIYDFTTSTMEDYSKGFDHSASSLNWTPKGKEIIFVSGVNATFQIYKLTLKNRKIEPITEGKHDYHSVALAGKNLIGTKVSMSKPQEIYRIDPKNGKETELSFENEEILNQLEMGKVEERWITTTDNKKMLTWVIYPPHFDPNKKYPTILYCEGGPQSPLSQFWSYRWNFQMMAANDYIVVAPNRRGVLTFGQEWTDGVSKDNGGQCMQDYLAAIDELKKEPYVDENNLGAVGASFGGFSVYWLAGNHENRFKTFIAHCGVFNSEMEYATTEEMFFDNWEKGGAFWELDNKVAQKSYASSPHKFVQNWDTPILVIHGGKDFRIPYTQGMAAFNSAQLKGIPSKFLYFPEENHWVLKPQNGILWQRTFFKWLDKWLKN
ncbi:MAG: prolyl oligopeptidase family serine peptidase [Marinifilaceae bacterium]